MPLLNTRYNGSESYNSVQHYVRYQRGGKKKTTISFKYMKYAADHFSEHTSLNELHGYFSFFQTLG